LNSITRRTATIVLIGAFAALSILISCDDRNEADIPPQAFHYAGSYMAGGIIKHVAADGNLAAIAASEAGMQILDVSNPESVTEVFTFFPGGFVEPKLVALSSEYGIAAAYFDTASSYYGWSVVLDFQAGEAVGTTSFGQGVVDLKLREEAQSSIRSLNIWGTDRAGGDGLVGIRYCYNYEGTDSARWMTSQCPYLPPDYHPARGIIRGFGINDSLAAAAIDVDGIHLYSLAANISLSDLNTPGIAYDCAWYGDYVVVADRYFATIVDASDPVNPVIVASLIIDGADRLVSVEVDGNQAALLDEADGVYIVDLSNPSDPKMVQEIKLSEPTSICTDNGRLYITDEQQGLLIYTR
jgi:hypothetical protein